MAITGAIFNSLVYGGVDSADYGVYVTGDAAFNAPKRSVELVSVPGRNGAIELDQGHFENIEVSYPAGMFGDDQTDFRERLSDFRNAIMSQKGYQRLSDTYHPDEYRMGIYVDGLEVEPKHYNEAGQFTLKFNCKPQRFLTSGEEVITIGEWEDYETVTGDKVTFEADDTTKIKDIKTDINPKQAGDAWSSSPEQAPYLLRRSPQLGHDYFKEFDTLIGGSIAWNQLVQNGNFADTSNWSTGTGTSISASNNVLTASASGANAQVLQASSIKFAKGHKVFLRCGIKASASKRVALRLSQDNPISNHHIINYDLTANTHTVMQAVFDVSVDLPNVRFSVFIQDSASGETYQLDNFIATDLTASFETEIANYIYGLEVAERLSGIAWLKSYGFLGKDYYAYDAGSLVSVKTSEHRTTGKNQLPLSVAGIKSLNTAETWDGNSYTRRGITFTILTDTSGKVTGIKAQGTAISTNDAYFTLYYDGATGGKYNGMILNGTQASDIHARVLMTNTTTLARYDVNGNGVVLDNDTTGIASFQIVVDKTSTVDVVLLPMLRFADVSDATFEPYIVHSYPLGNDDLRGIFKLSNGNLYADGDVKTSDGQIQRKYGIVVYDGSDDEDWSQGGWASGLRAFAPLSDAKDGGLAIASSRWTLKNDQEAGCFRLLYLSSQGRTVIDTYSASTSVSSLADLKTQLSNNPVTVVYELATPTTEQSTSFTNMQAVSPDGTEEYVDTRDVPVPVGHRTNYAAVYSISGYFTIRLYHSPTPDSADATEYEIDTGTAGVVYGGVLDVTAGKLLVTDKNINYYDGETLPSTWISDRDQYAPGTTPSTGAQVVYKIANPEEHDVDPTQIDALIGSNYVWSNSGDVTVEYGWNPNIIANPTLFDARPLLMVEGYGNIEMNSKDIELKRVVIGNVSIAGSETKQFGTSITMDIGFNPEQFNTGDAISVNPFVFASDYYYELHGDELTLYTATDQLQGAQTTFQKEGASYYKIQTAWPALTFYVGTDAEYTNEAIITGKAGAQGFLNQRLHTKVELSHRSSTYAVIKFTFNSGSMYEDLYVIATERKLILNGINGDSTLLTLGHPTCIDCDLGEAYMIKNGAVISLNAYIDLGSDLPSLGPGLNRIDFDDTITELKLRPDWWKV